MIRALGCLGLGGGFLIISPKLRESVIESLNSGVHELDLYSPWSYVAVVAAGLVMVMVYLYRAAQPR